jgi:endogenous inhibitor of DNA gyrase (YacG/DUF329 family)
METKTTTTPATQAEVDQVASKVAELAREGDEDQPEEVHGVCLGARVTMQCAECGTVLEPVDLTNSDPRPTREELDDYVVECPTCSQVAGHQVVIPLFILAGDQTTLVPDHPDDEAPAPPEAA